MREQMARLDGRLKQGSRDPSFAAGVQSKLSSALRTAELAGSELRELDCGGGLCRAELRHDDAAALSRVASGLGYAIQMNVRAFHAEDGKTTTLYLEKPGATGS
jgi:hypothetical protein